MRLFKNTNSDVWSVYIRVNGKRYRKSLGVKDKKLAQLKAVEFIREKENFMTTSMQLNKALEIYVTFKKTENTAKTVRDDRSRILKFINYYGGHREIGLVQEADIRSFIQKLSEETTLTKTGLNQYLKNIRTFFNYFYSQDVLIKNPVKRIRVIDPPENTPRFLKEEEVKKVFEIIKDRPYYNLALFCIYTGTRIGEAIKVKWKNIQFDRDLIIIENEGDEKRTKSKRYRTIPLHKKLYSVLSEMKKNAESKEAYLFKYKGYPKRMPMYLRKRGLDVTWHDFRHTFATTLYQKRQDIYLVKELLGHSEIKVTLKYARLVQDHAIKQMDKLDFDI